MPPRNCASKTSRVTLMSAPRRDGKHTGGTRSEEPTKYATDPAHVLRGGEGCADLLVQLTDAEPPLGTSFTKEESHRDGHFQLLEVDSLSRKFKLAPEPPQIRRLDPITRPKEQPPKRPGLVLRPTGGQSSKLQREAEHRDDVDVVSDASPIQAESSRRPLERTCLELGERLVPAVGAGIWPQHGSEVLRPSPDLHRSPTRKNSCEA